MENTLENKHEIIKTAARASMRHLCIPYKLAVQQVKEAFILAEKLAHAPRENTQQAFVRIRNEINAVNDAWDDYRNRRLRLHLGNRSRRALALN